MEKSKKKIGVLTLPLITNIGGNLQAYALMEKLRQLGHEPVLINRRHRPKDSGHDLPDRYKDRDDQKPLFSNFIGISNEAPNKKFIDTYISPITRPFHWSPQLNRHIKSYEFDAIIVGSDQVWRPRYAKNILFNYFLDFLPRNIKVKRISYAASFGTSDWEFNEKLTKVCRGLIEKFDAVSVREDSGIKLCRDHLGINAKHVLDPTLLLPVEHYVQKFSLLSAQPEKKGLITYILDVNAEKTLVVNKIAEMVELKTYPTNDLQFSVHDEREVIRGQSVEGWLRSLYHAEYIVTDSFHGAVFAILFNKPFIAYGNPERGISRFTSLLKMFGLEDRLIFKSSEINPDKVFNPIDWDSINICIEEQRMLSIEFLESSLSEKTSTSNTLNSNTRFKLSEVNLNPLKVLCSGCGVCVSESDGTLTMKFNSDGFLEPVAISDKIPANAVRVCPFNPNPDINVKDEDVLANTYLPTAKNFDEKVGRFEKAFVGFSKQFRATSSSGGIATFVFDKLIKEGIVDYLYVVQKDGDSGYQYKVFDKNQDITSISKTRYYPVTLEKLFSTISENEGRVAISGVPCFLKAIRLKQHYHPELKQKIPFLVGIFCGGLKSKHYTDFLAQRSGMSGAYFDVDYRVKDPNSTANDYSFAAFDAQGVSHSVKISKIGDMWGTGMFKSRACDFCTDVVAELADISLGDAWLPEYKQDGLGNSIVVTRSELADQIIKFGIQKRELALNSISADKVIQSQSGGFNHRHDGLGFRVWFAKNFTNTILPIIRSRLQKRIELPQALVQILRERSRSRSISNWSKSNMITSFESKMKKTLRTLKYATLAGNNRYEVTLAQILNSYLNKEKLNLSQQSRNYPKEYLSPLRWFMRTLNHRKQAYSFLADAFQEGVIAVPQALMAKFELSPTTTNQQVRNQKVKFMRGTLTEFSDISMWMVNAFDIYEAYGGQVITENNNKIIISGSKDIAALRNTNIFLSGENNEIVLHNLKNIIKLDVACVEGGRVHLVSPKKITKAVICASHGATVSIRSGCLVSRDVIIYGSNAHAVYNLDGTHRGLKNITIGNRVWLGQGVRILAGASVGDNSVIGSYGVLAGNVPNNCAAAGNPCRVTAKDIFWTISGSGCNLNYFERATNRGKQSPSFIKKTRD